MLVTIRSDNGGMVGELAVATHSRLIYRGAKAYAGVTPWAVGANIKALGGDVICGGRTLGIDGVSQHAGAALVG